MRCFIQAVDLLDLLFFWGNCLPPRKFMLVELFLGHNLLLSALDLLISVLGEESCYPKDVQDFGWIFILFNGECCSGFWPHDHSWF